MKSKTIVAILFSTFLLAACTSNEEDTSLYFPLKTQCIGPTNAEHNAVYLHGFTDSGFTGQERKNLQSLTEISKILNMRIAVPLSPATCSHKNDTSHCWGTEMTRTQARRAMRIATRSATECFNERKPFGVIGFSNGGYIATKFFSYCLGPKLNPNMKWIVTVGSAKLWGTGYSNRGSLHRCRPMTVVIGKRDRHNYDLEQKYFKTLMAKGASVSIIVFNGKHEVKTGPLISAIRKYID